MIPAELLEQVAAEGLTLALRNNRLFWKADHQPSPELLAELKHHKLAIIEALSAANDHEALCTSWRIEVSGYRPFIMISEPITEADALNVARWHWPDADVMPRLRQ